MNEIVNNIFLRNEFTKNYDTNYKDDKEDIDQVGEKILEMNDSQSLTLKSLDDIFTQNSLSDEGKYYILSQLEETIPETKTYIEEKSNLFAGMDRDQIIKKIESSTNNEVELIKKLRQIVSERYNDVKFVEENKKLLYKFVTKTTLYNMYKKSGEKVNKSDIHDIFNSIACTSQISYVKAIIGGQNIIKVFKDLNSQVPDSKYNREGFIYIGIQRKRKISTIVECDFNTGEATITQKETEEGNNIKILSNIGLKMKRKEDTKFKVEMYIEDTKYSPNMYVLSDVILNSIFSNIFFINEKKHVVSDKTDANITIGCRKLFRDRKEEEASDIRQITLKKDVSFFLAIEDDRIRVTLLEVNNVDILTHFSQVLSALLSYTYEKTDSVLAAYTRELSEMDLKANIELPIREISASSEDQYFRDVLKNDVNLKEIFGRSSAIPDENVPYYIGTDIPEDQKENVLGIPHDDPKFFFTCPDGKYVNYMYNTGDNKKIYPLLPVCLDEDTDIVTVEDKEIKSSNKKRIIVSNRILKNDTYGKIDVILLQSFLSKNIGISNPHRYGVSGKSEDSFLKCIYFALNDEFADDDDISEMKETLSELNPEIYYQDIPFSERKNISDRVLKDSSIDPRYIYHGVEEIYDVNIFLLTLREPYFVFKHDYCRNVRSGKKSIFVLINNKNCELIVSLSSESPPEIGDKVFYGVGSETMKNIGKLFKTLYVVPEGKNNRIYQNLNVGVDYTDVFTKLKPSHQIINNTGKCIGFVAPGGAMVYIQPSQPKNLPSVTADFGNYKEVKNTLIDPSSEKFIDTSSGTWYRSGGLNYAFHIFSREKRGNGITPLIPSSEQSSREKMIDVKTKAIYFKNLFRWLYKVYLTEDISPSKENRDKFFSEMTIIKNVDYKFGEIQSTLPKITDIKDALRYVSTSIKGSVSGGKFVISSQRLRAGLETFLRDYHVNGIPTLIKGISRFTPRKNTLVFKNNAQYQQWLFRDETRRNMVREKLSIKDALTTTPFVYSNKGNYYLIQNIENINNALEVALTICKNWRSKGINTRVAYEEKDMKEQTDYVVYGINSDGELYVLEGDTTKKGSLSILRLSISGKNVRYGAILPL